MPFYLRSRSFLTGQCSQQDPSVTEDDELDEEDEERFEEEEVENYDSGVDSEVPIDNTNWSCLACTPSNLTPLTPAKLHCSFSPIGWNEKWA